MIFFTVGTHEDGFDRLVRAANEQAARSPEKVVVQRGYTRVDAPLCETYDLLEPSVFERLILEARVVVTHAGPATIDRVLAQGRVPIVVPRQAGLGEHVDDHQVWFAASLRHQLPVVIDIADLPGVIAAHGSKDVAIGPTGWSNANPQLLASEFGNLVERVMLDRATRRTSVRATLGKWFRLRARP